MAEQFSGADVAQLRVLASAMSSAGNRLHAQLAGFNAGVAGTPWPGPDAERFRRDWRSSHSRSLLAAAAFLQQAARDLARNADEQDTASSAGGAAGGGARSGGAGTPAAAPATRPATADIAGKPAADVRAWWQALSPDQRREFIQEHPGQAGNTNGIPFADRIEANKANAQNRIDWLTDHDPEPTLDLLLVALDTSYPERFTAEHEQWETRQSGLGYLQKVADGKIQLAAYDPAGHSIVEMIGTYDGQTSTAITYVPGTKTSEASFYDGGPQSVSRHLVESDKTGGTVAFVYKGTEFPDGGDIEAFLVEAKSDSFVAETSPVLREFQAAVDLEKPAGAQTAGIGHSWGFRNLAGAETDGARYDKVIALSGAAMPPGWTPQPSTAYSSYTYPDVLWTAERSGVVGDNYPMKEPAFDKHVYAPPGTPAGTDDVDWTEHISIENHTLIATATAENEAALRGVRREINR